MPRVRPHTSRGHGLSPRAAGVLRGVVLGYLRTGEPVGSATVIRVGRVDASSATVRVELGLLTDAGLLRQPHTSAGRVPTQAGFRLYVDHLMRRRAPGPAERDGLVAALRDASDEPDALVRVASRELSSACTLVAIGRRPRLDEARVRRIELLALGGGRVMAVLVTDDDVVRHRVVRLTEGVGAVELLRAQGLFNQRWADLPLRDARQALRRQIEGTESGPSRRLLELAERVLPDADTPEDAVIVEGRTHLLAPDSDAEQLASVLQALEDKRLLLSLLDQLEIEDGTRVVFGEETEIEALKDFTVVSAAYGIDDRALGTVAIVGPVRINYARVVPWVGWTAKAISELLRREAA